MGGRAGRAGAIAVSFGLQGAMIVALAGLASVSRTSAGFESGSVSAAPVQMVPEAPRPLFITVSMSTQGQRGFAYLPAPDSAVSVPANTATFRLEPGADMVMALGVTVPAGLPVAALSLTVTPGTWDDVPQPTTFPPLLTVDGPIAAGRQEYTVRWADARPLQSVQPETRGDWVLMMTVQEPGYATQVPIAELTAG